MTKRKTPGIIAACDLLGSNAELARQLGVSTQVVGQWRKTGYVPVGRAAQIEALTGVSRAALINPKLRDAVDGDATHYF